MATDIVVRRDQIHNLRNSVCRIRTLAAERDSIIVDEANRLLAYFAYILGEPIQDTTRPTS